MLLNTSKARLGEKKLPGAPVDDNYVVVRRTGQPPLRFLGELKLCETSYRAGTKLWYEINIYKRTKDGYVCEVKQFTKAIDQNDRFRAKQCDTVGEIVSYLEHYDVKEDLVSSIAVEDQCKPTCDLVLEGIELRQLLQEAQLEFGFVSSAIFDTLIEYDQSC